MNTLVMDDFVVVNQISIKTILKALPYFLTGQ